MKTKKTVEIIVMILCMLVAIFVGCTAYMQYQNGKQSEVLGTVRS